MAIFYDKNNAYDTQAFAMAKIEGRYLSGVDDLGMLSLNLIAFSENQENVVSIFTAPEAQIRDLFELVVSNWDDHINIEIGCKRELTHREIEHLFPLIVSGKNYRENIEFSLYRMDGNSAVLVQDGEVSRYGKLVFDDGKEALINAMKELVLEIDKMEILYRYIQSEISLDEFHKIITNLVVGNLTD